MTFDSPAITRPVPLVERARSVLSRLRRKRAAFGGDDPYLLVHLHDRPRASAHTSVGIVPVDVVSACLYEDALVFRMILFPDQDMDVESIIVRLGEFEMDVSGEEVLSLRAGDQARFSWAAQFGAMGIVGPTVEDPPATPDDPTAAAS